MNKNKAEIASLLKKRSLLKQDVYEKSAHCYGEFRKVIENEIERLTKEINNPRVRLKLQTNGDFETHAYVGSDVLVFNMHTNVFTQPNNSSIWKDSYFEKNPEKGYFGIINIYNFLAESFLQKRMNDPGYLLCRILVNIDGRFIIEGKGELGYLYRNIRNNIFDQATMKVIFDQAVKYAAEFDLYTPTYESASVVNVMQIKSVTSAQKLKTGKRLGFRFKNELK
ncbi:hypothetical protein CW751_07655 [Brumimicrobium salinarum]|uniref:Uncharacterized protein n=1 Tax=Brumimicrobium salinarum TaxID=2058658 RepID=A0A2I0R3Q1_9FLAO|nr:hypothetical protein [Brumimicrobium salinarum]PKR81030.1 hypothetical protein CW751_07655 [Brumimicrobium salinarum]